MRNILLCMLLAVQSVAALDFIPAGSWPKAKNLLDIIKQLADIAQEAGVKVVIVEPDSEMGLMIMWDKLDQDTQTNMLSIAAEAYQAVVCGGEATRH